LVGVPGLVRLCLLSAFGPAGKKSEIVLRSVGCIACYVKAHWLAGQPWLAGGLGLVSVSGLVWLVWPSAFGPVGLKK